MRRTDLADLLAFVVVGDKLSFRAAAARLEVTPSALSHTMRQLEQRLGVRLLHRTTRSVALTDAGLRLMEQLHPALSQISEALEGLNEARSRPVGRLRIHTWLSLAAHAVIAPLWSDFLATYPEVELEIRVEDGRVDIVADGFDAGLGLRDFIPADMIAVKATGPLKMAVVGAPSYLERHTAPFVPEDLAHHVCVRFRRPGGQEMIWQFERDADSRQISAEGPLTVNSPELALRAALDGLGLVYTLEGLAEPFIRSGQLVRVLESWSPHFEGMFLYYPGHRHVPAGLRALIDMIRARQGAEKSLPVLANLFTFSNGVSEPRRV